MSCVKFQGAMKFLVCRFCLAMSLFYICCFQVKWVPVLIWICSPPAFAFLSCETSEFFPGAQGTPSLTLSWLRLLYSITRDEDIYDGQIAIGLTNSLWHICYLIPCRSRISGVSLFLWISSRWYSLSIFTVSSVISECCTIKFWQWVPKYLYSAYHVRW